MGRKGDFILLAKNSHYAFLKYLPIWASRHSSLGVLLLLLHFISFRCSDSSLYSISLYKTFPGLGLGPFLHQFSSYTNDPSLAVDYRIKSKWLSMDVRILHA